MPTVKNTKKNKKRPTKDKDKLLAGLDLLTPETVALDIIQHYILNPLHSKNYSRLTYVDEVVLLCLLKDVEVSFNDEDANYYIDGQIVTDSVNKLIDKGYIHYNTLVPNKGILKRLYIKHPFSDKSKFISEEVIRKHIDYYVVDDFEQARSKWKAKNFFITLSNSMELPRFENERISFTTFVNIAANKPRVHTPKDKSLDAATRFDFNVSRLEQITSVLLDEIRGLLQEQV